MLCSTEYLKVTIISISKYKAYIKNFKILQYKKIYTIKQLYLQHTD